MPRLQPRRNQPVQLCVRSRRAQPLEEAKKSLASAGRHSAPNALSRRESVMVIWCGIAVHCRRGGRPCSAVQVLSGDSRRNRNGSAGKQARSARRHGIWLQCGALRGMAHDAVAQTRAVEARPNAFDQPPQPRYRMRIHARLPGRCFLVVAIAY